MTTKPIKRTSIAEPLSVLVLVAGLGAALILSGWLPLWGSVAVVSFPLALAVGGFRTVARVR